ncbi:ABC transporter ATP-binding protein [Gottfriedia sp. NPDC056225]|uniref:ABC transporter ATP-binding protein n=1 Tax=Gottfriedia sp. NPDC056225 TaxID=3345751 RepID=UPI0015588C93|nr:ATP-binding cassette domain-containing protein [Arthrobacter citreus]
MTLEIKQLSKKFGDAIAVNQLSLTLPKGRVLGLLGRNGAGKTTTIKMLIGLLTPTNGEINWEGIPFKTTKVKVGYLPEERGLFTKSKVVDQLKYFGKLEGMSNKEVDKEITYWLDRLEIPHYRNKKAGELSKGNQQKIQLIVTLLHNPELIILDEPFSGLDPVNADLMASIITEEIEKGKTVILSSHRMDQVEAFCEHVCILKNGNVVAEGSLSRLKEEYGYRNLILEDIEPIKQLLASKNVSYEQKHSGIYVKVKSDEEAFTILDHIKSEIGSIRKFQLLEPTLNDIFIERAR